MVLTLRFSRDDPAAAESEVDVGLIVALLIIVLLVIALVALGVYVWLEKKKRGRAESPPVAYSNSAMEP